MSAKKASVGGKKLWTPSPQRQAAARITEFMRLAAARAGRDFDDYQALHAWSVEDLPAFWKTVWDFFEITAEGDLDCVLEEPSMPGARWFPGARLNFAENLLRHASETTRDAIIFESEDESLRRVITYPELARDVARCAAGLRQLGVGKGDRVAALTPNVPEAVIAMLATTSLGAIWSSCSPDFGKQGILDRFGQIQPKVLLSADGYVYGGKRFGMGERLAELVEEIQSIEHTVVYHYRGPNVSGLRGQLDWIDLLGKADRNPGFERFPFAQPAYILYTSGTTGVPKCIVHGAGGTLLKHLEELAIQSDVRSGDVLFYFTTCGWMMWNWLVSGLATGATLVLYDGSPTHPDVGRLFRMIDRDRITHFGTSPRFLSAVESVGLEPGKAHSLESLRSILSTGSPLNPTQFEWVYRSLKDDVQVASISGGTDLIGCFVLGSPIDAVYSGEIQCRALGMKVESVDTTGKALIGEKGELVCSAPFPSMPVSFWNDPDGSRYRSAYFERYPGRWHHGDFIEITERGSVIIYGRSDATLNPGGVRIGTAEIYRAVEQIAEVTDALAIGHEVDGDVRIVLFVVTPGGIDLDEKLEAKIRAAIRSETSPRHVPYRILPISEVPRTISGKTVELAVGQILRGEEALNRDALANPESLDQFKALRSRL